MAGLRPPSGRLLQLPNAPLVEVGVQASLGTQSGGTRPRGGSVKTTLRIQRGSSRQRGSFRPREGVLAALLTPSGGPRPRAGTVAALGAYKAGPTVREGSVPGLGAYKAGPIVREGSVATLVTRISGPRVGEGLVSADDVWVHPLAVEADPQCVSRSSVGHACRVCRARRCVTSDGSCTCGLYTCACVGNRRRPCCYGTLGFTSVPLTFTWPLGSPTLLLMCSTNPVAICPLAGVAREVHGLHSVWGDIFITVFIFSIKMTVITSVFLFNKHRAVEILLRPEFGTGR